MLRNKPSSARLPLTNKNMPSESRASAPPPPQPFRTPGYVTYLTPVFVLFYYFFVATKSLFLTVLLRPNEECIRQWPVTLNSKSADLNAI